MEVRNSIFKSDENINFDFSREEVNTAFSFLKIAIQKKFPDASEENIIDLVSDYMLMYSTPVKKSFIKSIKEKLNISTYKQLFYFKDSWTRTYIVVNEYGKIIK